MENDMSERRSALAPAGLRQQPETLTDRLHGEKRDLERRLEQIDELLKQLDENPGVHVILDALAKLGQPIY